MRFGKIYVQIWDSASKIELKTFEVSHTSRISWCGVASSRLSPQFLHRQQCDRLPASKLGQCSGHASNTGIASNYEAPESPDVHCKTAGKTFFESVNMVWERA
jgi:hypothetical protein